ncbi:MAG: OmpA/MotB family protein [Saprospiraceae bacterium]|jgi:chemotaxis protein MotB
MKKIPFFLFVVLTLGSCVAKKEYNAMLGTRDDLVLQLERMKISAENCEADKAKLQNELNALRTSLRDRENALLTKNTELLNERGKSAMLEQQLEYFKTNNANLLDRLADLSVVSKTGAENIKKSLEAIDKQSTYIQDLTSAIQRKDSLALNLVMNLKRSLADVNDEDVTVEVRKGVVYISLSDRMLFRSGSADISQQAETILSKIAKVLNDYKELEILVEGHTDSVPISNACISDNWDLSAKRATAVVRNLQRRYGVDPRRMTAGGCSEYRPKATNVSDDGRRANRRTEIVILPNLDQFFQLLEPK